MAGRCGPEKARAEVAGAIIFLTYYDAFPAGIQIRQSACFIAERCRPKRLRHCPAIGAHTPSTAIDAIGIFRGGRMISRLWKTRRC